MSIGKCLTSFSLPTLDKTAERFGHKSSTAADSLSRRPSKHQKSAADLQDLQDSWDDLEKDRVFRSVGMWSLALTMFACLLIVISKAQLPPVIDNSGDDMTVTLPQSPAVVEQLAVTEDQSLATSTTSSSRMALWVQNVESEPASILTDIIKAHQNLQGLPLKLSSNWNGVRARACHEDRLLVTCFSVYLPPSDLRNLSLHPCPRRNDAGPSLGLVGDLCQADGLILGTPAPACSTCSRIHLLPVYLPSSTTKVGSSSLKVVCGANPCLSVQSTRPRRPRKCQRFLPSLWRT